eukprot:CAMPEP_0196163060 /NCGR_PEP_ID=MMETSP0910-20130528/48151_1 /TAXON_ID=49265 /ORGANISM="Thalassiosira rotula, Strain GSO102" /LENGTH=390 /DNA_ID=CAMNT_0041428019 /DNA_START=63 /DNA_END=1233 /DNA_ORIENTATION=-
MANDPNNQSPIFEGLSTEEPSVLTISFASDPCASLGVKLCNHDNGLTNEMFLPGYASVGGMLDGNTLAKKHGVKVGDHIVAVNGEGFRRFPPDFQDEHLQDITEGLDLINLSGGENGYYAAGEGEILDDEKERNRELKGRVVTGKKSGEVYERLLAKIREIKSGAGRSPSSNPPLLISLERYMWDSRVHSWSRFLSARNGNVPEAMTLIQGHERWRNEFFPIDLTEPSLQKLLRVHAVSKIDVGKTEEEEDKAPVVYIDFAKLQAMGVESVRRVHGNVVVEVAGSEESENEPVVDLTGVSIKQGLQPGVLKKLYATFEPNYPETLEKMVLYPVPRIMVRAVNAMLSFVNEHTRKKFIITDDLFLVCKELGWNLKEIETCGSVNSYMKKHL